MSELAIFTTRVQTMHVDASELLHARYSNEQPCVVRPANDANAPSASQPAVKLDPA